MITPPPSNYRTRVRTKKLVSLYTVLHRKYYYKYDIHVLSLVRYLRSATSSAGGELYHFVCTLSNFIFHKSGSQSLLRR